jgi:hypothetical protein
VREIVDPGCLFSTPIWISSLFALLSYYVSARRALGERPIPTKTKRPSEEMVFSTSND